MESILCGEYVAEEQTEIKLELEGLDKGAHTVYVIAENAYEMQAEPIGTVMTVDGENAFKSFFIRIGIWFKNLISRIKALL